MTTLKLVPHPDAPPLIDGIAITLEQRGDRLRVTWRIEGDTGNILWPAPAAPGRKDELWKHTCFEVFIGHPDHGYAEYNFSPSGEWASYLFDGYRQGMRPAIDLPEPAITSGPGWLAAEIDLAAHRGAGRGDLAITAVIESNSGAVAYWALAHKTGAPDFHHAAGFCQKITAPAQPAPAPPSIG